MFDGAGIVEGSRGIWGRAVLHPPLFLQAEFARAADAEDQRLPASDWSGTTFQRPVRSSPVLMATAGMNGLTRKRLAARPAIIQLPSALFTKNTPVNDTS